MLIKVILTILLLVSSLYAETLSSITLSEGMFTTFGLWVNGTLNYILIDIGLYRLLVVLSVLYSLRKLFIQKNIVEPVINIIVLVLIIFLFIKPGSTSYDFNDMTISEIQNAQDEENRTEIGKQYGSYVSKSFNKALGSEPSDWFMKVYNSIDKLIYVIIDVIDKNYRYSHYKYKTYQINNKIDLGLHDPELIQQFKMYNELCYYPAISTFADGELYSDGGAGMNAEQATALQSLMAYSQLTPYYINKETSLYSQSQNNMNLAANGCKEKTNELTTSVLTKSYDRNSPLYNSREEAVTAGISLYFFKIGEFTDKDWAEDYVGKLYMKGELTTFMGPDKKVDLDENFAARWMHQFSTWKDSFGKYVSLAGILNMYPYVQGITLGFFIAIFPIIICYSFFGNFTIIVEYFKMILWVKSWTIVTTLAVLFDKMSVGSDIAGESAMEVALYSMALSAPVVSFVLIRVTSNGIATGIMQSAAQSSNAAGASAASMVTKAPGVALNAAKMMPGPVGAAANVAGKVSDAASGKMPNSKGSSNKFM